MHCRHHIVRYQQSRKEIDHRQQIPSDPTHRELAPVTPPHQISPPYLAHRSPLPPMGFDQSQHRLLLTRHQPPALSQSKFISFFNSLIKSAWFSTTSLSFRFSASKRLRSAVFNGRLLRNDARTPTSNCRFHF